MKFDDVAMVKLDMKESARSSVSMLAGEIPGASVFHHTVPAGGEIRFPEDPAFLRVLFLCGGGAVFSSGNQSRAYNEKAVFIASPKSGVDVTFQDDSHLLEIQWILTDADWKEIQNGAAAFPLTIRYRDAVQYRDPFKSEKTISRAIVPHRILPRFAMGSVETYAEDLIGKHEHPLLDQFFFSFPENDMDLLLDDLVYPMTGNALVHIPLGCDHGVSVTGSQCAHYLWIDFISGEDGLAYLDSVHKETGDTRSFDETGKRKG
ncbi:MAG: hypothetical protein LBQ57_11760 [Spirochaetales bacterium]|jgi:hypothetical protein|nr:hypothetical protein [Spirochaetales bacterium]